MSSIVAGVNDYTTITSRLVSELLSDLSQYQGLIVERRLFKLGDLPPIGRYGIIVSPARVPWREVRETVQGIAYLLSVDLYLFVRNYNEEASLWGTVAPNLGVFQMIEDVKELLRLSNLSGMLQKTYDEPAGPGSQGVAVEYGAVPGPGLDTGEYAFFHRAMIPYTGRLTGFCYPRNFS